MINLPSDPECNDLGYYHDSKQPEAVIRWIEKFCIQSQSPFTGKPVKVLPYWRDILSRLYGDKTPTGDNRFNRLWLFVPKKQAKSTYSAILCLYTLLREEGSEVYSIAATKEQARKTVYGQAEAFVNRHPALKALLKCRPHIKTIERRDKQGEFVIWSSDHGKISGINPNLVCCDEIAEWSKGRGRETWDKLQGASCTRKNPLMIVSTTAGFDRSSFAYDLYRNAKKILTNESRDLQTLPVIYEIPESADWRDENEWWKALPAVDFITPKQWYRDEYRRIEGNPLEEVTFRTLNVGNQWIGSPVTWIPYTFWDACKTTTPKEELRGQQAILAIDYGASYDLTCLQVIVKQDDVWHCQPHFFIPEKIAHNREREHGIPYSRYVQSSTCNLTLTEGDVVDTNELIRRIELLAQEYKITEVRYDPTRLEGTRQNIERLGYPCVEVKQHAKSMSPCYSMLERIIRDRKLRHPDCPILNAHLGNCRPSRDQFDRLTITKASPMAKIDGIASLALGLSHWLEYEHGPPPGAQLVSVW